MSVARDVGLSPAGSSGPAIEWETADCPLCGGRQWSKVLETPDVEAEGGGPLFAVVRCEACGLCFTNPRPGPASIGQFYPADYGPHQRMGLSPARRRRAVRHARMPAFWRNRSPNQRGIPLHGQGRVLDFGCGRGSFLERMQLQGWDVLGLDISTATVERIRSRLGVPCLAGTLPHPELLPESFDVVTMWASLEHVHQPLEVLREAYRLLAPGGKLLASVPNIDGAAFGWFGPAWFPLELPRHLTHFSPKTLDKMFRRAGFRTGRVRMFSRSHWLRNSAQLARQQGRPRPLQWLAFKPLARLVAAWCVLTRQAEDILITGVKPG